MTPELHDFATALTADIRKLAQLVERLAGLQGYDQTVEDARQVAVDVVDAYNQLEGQ